MTMYYAAVKYALDDPPARKVDALRDGLETIAMALIEEHGIDLEQVREWLSNAESAAEWSANEVASR
jgi:hypothetical protein